MWIRSAPDLLCLTLLSLVKFGHTVVKGTFPEKELMERLEPTIRSRVAEARQLMAAQTGGWHIPVHSRSEECRLHSDLLLDSTLRGESWALRMRDASSQTVPGVMDGVMIDLGHYDQCLAVQEPNQLFKGQYCLVETEGIIPQELHFFINYDLSNVEFLKGKQHLLYPAVEIYLAVCVPSTCTAQDIMTHTQVGLSTINATSAVYNTSCSTTDPRTFGLRQWLAVSVFGSIAILIVLSTAYEYRAIGSGSELRKSFSLISNFQELMDTKRRKGDIGCLDGLRVFGTATVVFFHQMTVPLAFPALLNNTNYESLNDQFALTLFENLIRVVDIFFLMAGIVRSYNFFIDRLKQNPLEFLRPSVFRYFRYTPTLAVLILFSSTLFSHVGAGPLWLRMTSFIEWKCSLVWWTGLLHITNYFNLTFMCEMESWYVAADLQLFMVALLFLLPLYWRPWLGLMFMAVCSVCSVVSHIVYVFTKEIYSGNLTMCFRSNKSQCRVDERSAAYTYAHFRLPTYLLGLAVGYLLFMVKWNKTRIILSKATLRMGWTISFMVVVVLFVVATNVVERNHLFSPWVDPWYHPLSKLLMAAVAAWVILVCDLGYGGLINHFLSWPGFRPLAKLSLGIFYVNMDIILFKLYRLRQPNNFNYIEILYIGLGDLGLSLILALVLYLSVERPSYRVVSYLIRRPSSGQEVASTKDSSNLKKRQ